MRKTFLFFLMTFLMSWSTLNAQQGIDYIIMVDNGGSISTKPDYAILKRGVVKLIEQLLFCNIHNRVAVVQYGTGVLDNDTGVYKPLIYIESEFTNDFFTAQNFERRLDFGDYLQQSVALVKDALSGVSNPDIISPQKTLGFTQEMRFVIFTDAERASSGLSSYLVDPTYASNIASYEAFGPVMDFKTNNWAGGATVRFTVIHANKNNNAIMAAASIASPFGDYSGPLEAVAGDPGYGLKRSYFNKDNGFDVKAGEVNYWKDIAESICFNSSNTSKGIVDFLYEPGSCIYKPGVIEGDYHLPAGATLQELKVELINLVTGEVYPVLSNPVLGPGNTFTFNFVPYSSFAPALTMGSTGWHKFRVAMTSSASASPVYRWNRYPFFDFDIDLDQNCPQFRASEPQVMEKVFQLTPNPTSGLFKVVLNKEFKKGTLEVRDLIGNTLYNKILRGEKEIDVDLSSRKEGVYIVSVTTDKNEIYSEKIIKK
ncbi:Por secretion system C-terminal sorting domain [Chryseobacterium nakagawai]|uniref:T9SS C-terminal target domain-containing protein n=1 Tax=Chryseobacterium nakagawai TaxID=1241982 RepID=A0AAD0YMG9_CHRNA|nr:T9SS type A sorting domain-containing protein [Chryseobacterium nakagawai]AZA93206.1 T9SS C-terminal target domain-containing protein [Chryseobacterium nakagawai]VEH19860.1 Por secretion system C-terminal sorting domain [Chryseobacterium nakagawai]